MNLNQFVLSAGLLRVFALPILILGGAAPSVSVAAPIKTEQSAVAISITSNTSQIDTFDRLRLQRMGSSQDVVLKKTEKLVSRGTSLFTGTLPAGEYKVALLEDTKSHLNLQLTEDSGYVGNFRVKGGGPVDLGRLIITPVNLKVFVGRSSRVTSNVPLLKVYAPEQAPLFEKEAGGGWSEPRRPDDKVEEYAISKPGDFDCITEKDGIVLAGGRMGTLMQRQVTGQWLALSGPSIAALSCALPVTLPNADLLVTGEFGTLLRHAKGDAKLLPVSTGDLPFGHLLRIVGNGVGGWYIAGLRGDTVSLHYSQTLENGKWTEVRSEKIERLPGRQGLRFWIWPIANGLAYTTGRDTIQTLDFATRQWSALALPEKQKFSSLKISPSGTLAIAGGGKHFVSYDAGKHWDPVKVTLPKGVVDVGPVQQMADGAFVMQSLNNAQKSAIYRSADKGQSWQVMKQFDWPYRVQVLKSVPLLQIGDESSFGFVSLSSSTDGANWKSEYSSFDREFDEREKKRKAK